MLVPDTPSFYAELTGWEHLQFLGQLRGLRGWKDDADRLPEVFGLTAHKEAYPSSFSRGMQYKLALRIALLTAPRVLLLDEPFGPPDAHSAEALWRELERFAAGGGVALVAAHQLPEVVTLREGHLPLGREDTARSAPEEP